MASRQVKSPDGPFSSRVRPELDLCVAYLQNFWIAEPKHEENGFKDHRLSQPLPGYVTQTLLARRFAFWRVGPFDESLKVGDPADWFLHTGEQRLVTELLPDLLAYQRMHDSNLSVELGTRRMTASMQNAILDVVKASLDRRRLHNEGGPRPLKFPTSRGE